MVAMVWDNFPNGPEHNVANYGDCCEPFFTSMEIGISIHKTLNYFPYCGQVVCMCLVHLFHRTSVVQWLNTAAETPRSYLYSSRRGGGVRGSNKIERILKKGQCRDTCDIVHKPYNDEKQNTKRVHDAGYSRNASCALN